MANATSAPDVGPVIDVEALRDAEAPPPKPTGRQRRDGGQAASSAASSKGKGGKKGKPELTPELVAAATAGWERMITLGMIAVQSFVPSPFPPTPEEAEAIRPPLSRILGRHYPIPEISGEAEDLFALVIAGAMYTARVFSDLQTMRSAPPPLEPEPSPRPTSRPSPSPATAQEPPAPSPRSNAQATAVPPDSTIRAARPGEGTGVPPEELVGPPDEVLARLHKASYQPEANA